MLGSTKSFAPRLLEWYDRARRDLPWRTLAAGSAFPDPYHVLVSEAMLQQTQVATVVPYFGRFINRYPTLVELAAADEQAVLLLWQGLGYYSRARNLLSAARKVVSEFGGKLPREAGQLLELPGIGRYTAGAIASIAFGQRAAILDGNVERVLCRLDNFAADPRLNSSRAELWRRAEEIIPKKRPGDFNSALMELGAMICTPRSPQCPLCPVRGHCAARAAGSQDRLPAAKKARLTPLFHRHVLCIRHGDRWLIEQRPARGRWAGMWQFVTVDAGEGDAAPDLAALTVPVSGLQHIGAVTHSLTHRRYRFVVYQCNARAGANKRSQAAVEINGDRVRAWVTLQGLASYPLPRPHLKVAAILEEKETKKWGQKDKNTEPGATAPGS